MSSVPVLKPREVIKAFEKLSWQVARQKGSHIVMTKEGHVATLSTKPPYRRTGHAKRPYIEGRYYGGIFSRSSKVGNYNQ